MRPRNATLHLSRYAAFSLSTSRERFASQDWETENPMYRRESAVPRRAPASAPGGRGAMSKILGLILTAIVLRLVAGGAGVGAAKHARPGPTITHGVVVGDVTASSALLWARTDREATLNVVLSGGRHGRVERAETASGDDFTARVPLEHLAPEATYRYRAWFSRGSPGSSHGPSI